MAKTIWLAMRAYPWERFSVNTGDKDEDGKPKSIQARGDYHNAGFLPVYWDAETALKANPGAQVQEAQVNDDWGERPPPPTPVQGQSPEKLMNLSGGPQGDQVPGDKPPWDFSDLDKRGRVKKAKELEATLEELGMENFVVTVRQFVLGGKKATSKLTKNELLSYVQALYKITELRKDDAGTDQPDADGDDE